MTTTTSPPTQPSHPSPPSPNPNRTYEARAAFTTHLASIGQSHLSALQPLASDIQSNSLAISKQEDTLKKNTKKLADERKKYEKVVGEVGGGLKEMGDLQNWAEVLERDLVVLEEAMDMGEREEDGWVTEEEGEDGEEVGDGDKMGVRSGVGQAKEVEEEETRSRQRQTPDGGTNG